MGKKVIVFGGSGFLGSHVADALSELPNVKSCCLIGMGCALGVHAGPKSLSVGVQEFPDFE